MGHAPPPEDPRPLDAGEGGAIGHADGWHHGADDAAHGGAPADARLLSLVADLRRRLGPACREWSEEAFESLIREIALRKLRWGEAAKRH